MMAKRERKEYDEASLAQTEKFSFLSPDFSTIWNYRREIINHLFSLDTGSYSSLEGKLGLIKSELTMLMKGIKMSPKSYTLWFHRQWIIEKGLVHEREAIALAVSKAKQAKADAETPQN